MSEPKRQDGNPEDDAVAKRIEQKVTAENGDATWAVAHGVMQWAAAQRETNERLKDLANAVRENQLDHTAVSQRLHTTNLELASIRILLQTNADFAKKAAGLCITITAVADDLDAVVANGVTAGEVAKNAGALRGYAQELMNLCG